MEPRLRGYAANPSLQPLDKHGANHVFQKHPRLPYAHSEPRAIFSSERPFATKLQGLSERLSTILSTQSLVAKT